MNKIIFSGMAFLGLTIYSYAELSEPVAEKVADILTAKINADKEVAIVALKSASMITIDGEPYTYVTINVYNDDVERGERVVMVGNTGVVLLGDINIRSVKDIVNIQKDFVVLNSSSMLGLFYQRKEDTNKTSEKEK